MDHPEEKAGKILHRGQGAVEYLEDLIENTEEEILLASCRLLKIYPVLDRCNLGIERAMGFLDINKFREACTSGEEDDELAMKRAKMIHKNWNGQVSSWFSATDEIPFKPYDLHELELLKSTLGEDLYCSIRKGFREMRVAKMTGVYGKPWNTEEHREATLEELLDKVRVIAHNPRRRNQIRREN